VRRPGSCPAPRRTAGFTLIELTIGAALMTLILASAYACMHSALSARRVLEPRLDATQTARVAIGLLTSDLRSVCALSPEHDFIGMSRSIAGVEADNLDFGTMNHSPRRPGEGDFCQTSYFVDMDQRTGERVLWRRRNPRIGSDPFRGGSREEIARGIRVFRLEYYDGFDWYDTWGDTEGNGKQQSSALLEPNLSGFPEAVRITLSFVAGDRAPAVGPAPDPSAEGPAADVSSSSVEAGSTEGAADPGELLYQTIVRVNALSTPGGGGGGGGEAGGSSGGAPSSGSGGSGSTGPGSTSGSAGPPRATGGRR